jgi:hypothetical protein
VVHAPAVSLTYSGVLPLQVAKDAVTPDSSSSDGDDQMKEWSAARAVIDKFDGYQSDLRKYGFTLVTGLLSVAGLFSSSPSVSFPPSAKFGVVSSILVLIVALSFLDAQYRYLQKGATIRARVLERSLNLDLTSAIAEYLRVGRFESRYTALYLGFAIATLTLGIAILSSVPPLVLLLLLVFAGAVAATLLLHPGPVYGLSDWSTDRKVVKAGECVKVTYTNLASSPEQLLATAPRPLRRSWMRRLRTKGVTLRLRPEGHVKGPRPIVGASTGSSPDVSLALPQGDVEFEYLTQVDWIWMPPHDSPGLYTIKGTLHLGLQGPGTEGTKPAKGSTFRLVVQVTAASGKSSQAGGRRSADEEYDD